MNTTNNKGAPRNGTPSKTPRGNSNSVHAQRQRLLERLKVAPVDTITARRELDVMHPAARIMELKRRGNQIDTVWVERPTDCGKVHRVALYVLQPGGVADE
ncbi:MAG: helix-turn-helix domain-containing protein [Candidatus Nitrotoga sp.]